MIIFLKRFFNQILLFINHLFSKRYLAKCGHKTYKRDNISAFEKSRILEIPIEDDEANDCHRCLGKMTIKCAWCEKPIFIGSPITLYSPTDKKGFKLPKHAVIYDKEKMAVVGCLRWDCVNSVIDRAGFWYPPGKVERVPSPLEIVMATNSCVIVQDLSDPNEIPIICKD